MMKPEKIHPKVVIDDFGIADFKITGHSPNDTPEAEDYFAGEDFHLVKITDSIPGVLGSKYMFIYTVTSDRAGVIPLSYASVFPSMMNCGRGEIKELRMSDTYEVNKTYIGCWVFEADCEIIKGTWWIYFYYGKKVIGKKKFVVY